MVSGTREEKPRCWDDVVCALLGKLEELDGIKPNVAGDCGRCKEETVLSLKLEPSRASVRTPRGLALTER